ncbi:MAG: hypothetical protein ACR2P5_04635 [Gammaproteobacteria bacterium]
MGDGEIYEMTRGTWKIGDRCNAAEYAFAVIGGVVRGVYCIDEWFSAGTTKYPLRPEIGKDPARREFIGKTAPPEILKMYLGESVADYFVKGNQSAFIYAGDWSE